MNKRRLKYQAPAFVAAVILMLLAPIPFLSVTMIRRQAAQLVLDSTMGLTAAGQINADIAEGLSETLQAILTSNAEHRQFHLERITAIATATDRQLDLYKTSIFEPDDEQNFTQLIQCRDQYRQTRQRVLAAIPDSDPTTALKLFHSALIPQYNLYLAAANQLFRYNVYQATARGQNILHFCRFTQISQMIVGIVILLAGWLLPFLVMRLFDDPASYEMPVRPNSPDSPAP